MTEVLVGARPLLAVGSGLFLLWLAWTTARAEPHDSAAAHARRGGPARAYLSILGLTLANPMTILSFGALFAGLWVTSGDTAGAALITLGVLLGSTGWWVVLTSIVSVMRRRITTTWTRRINVASGFAIGGFAVISIASVVMPV